MRSKLTNLVSAALCAALLPAIAPAHAFDCSKARTATEKAICASERVKDRDDLMEAAYLALRRMESTDREALRASQLAWLRERSACRTEACLYRSTDTRLRDLSDALERSVFGLGSAVSSAVRAAYPERIASLPGCRLLRADDLAYCMRPYLAQAVTRPGGSRELFVVYSGQVVNLQTGSFADPVHADAGRLGVFIFGEAQGAWHPKAVSPAEPNGMYGLPFLPVKLARIGPDTWSVTGGGGNLHSGYDSEWTFHIFPRGGRIVHTALSTYSSNEGAVVCEDEKDEKCKAQIAEYRATAEIAAGGAPRGGIWPYRVTVRGRAGGKPYGPRTFTLPFDPAEGNWRTPEDFPL